MFCELRSATNPASGALDGTDLSLTKLHSSRPSLKDPDNVLFSKPSCVFRKDCCVKNVQKKFLWAYSTQLHKLNLPGFSQLFVPFVFDEVVFVAKQWQMFLLKNPLNNVEDDSFCSLLKFSTKNTLPR